MQMLQSNTQMFPQYGQFTSAIAQNADLITKGISGLKSSLKEDRTSQAEAASQQAVDSVLAQKFDAEKDPLGKTMALLRASKYGSDDLKKSVKDLIDVDTIQRDINWKTDERKYQREQDDAKWAVKGEELRQQFAHQAAVEQNQAKQLAISSGHLRLDEKKYEEEKKLKEQQRKEGLELINALLNQDGSKGTTGSNGATNTAGTTNTKTGKYSYLDSLTSGDKDKKILANKNQIKINEDAIKELGLDINKNYKTMSKDDLSKKTKLIQAYTNSNESMGKELSHLNKVDYSVKPKTTATIVSGSDFTPESLSANVQQLYGDLNKFNNAKVIAASRGLPTSAFDLAINQTNEKIKLFTNQIESADTIAGLKKQFTGNSVLDKGIISFGGHGDANYNFGITDWIKNARSKIQEASTGNVANKTRKDVVAMDTLLPKSVVEKYKLNKAPPIATNDLNNLVNNLEFLINFKTKAKEQEFIPTSKQLKAVSDLEVLLRQDFKKVGLEPIIDAGLSGGKNEYNIPFNYVGRLFGGKTAEERFFESGGGIK